MNAAVQNLQQKFSVSISSKKLYSLRHLYLLNLQILTPSKLVLSLAAVSSFFRFSATACASSSVSCAGPLIEALRVTRSNLLRYLVLTRHREENPRSGQAVDRGIDNAIQQSICNSKNISRIILSLAILLQTSPAT